MKLTSRLGIVIGVVVVAALAGWLVSVRYVKKPEAAAATAAAAAGQKTGPQVELAASDIVVAKTQMLAQGLAISGQLKAVNSAVVKARVAGEVQGLSLREGDPVRAGQVVARIDPAEFQSRLRQAQEQADAAKAQIDIAQRQYDNNKALVDQGFISKTALDTSLANLNAANANYKAAGAAVEVAAKTLADTQLRSPLSGWVSARAVQTGERVGIDARVLEVVDLRQLELEANVSAADSTAIAPGQIARLQVEGSSQAVLATVVRLNPSAQAGSRSVLVYLKINNTGANASPALRQGLFAQGTLGIAQSAVVAVPVSAVRTDKPLPYVQVIENDRIVHQAVGLGLRGEASVSQASDGQVAAASAASGEALVGTTGLVLGAKVLRGSVGPVQEGTLVKFTK
jgi:membrane fusion protein, multidrug efflux system